MANLNVAVVSDSHFDTASRFEECIRIHDWIADDIKKRDVHLLLHAGDVFERKSNPQERIAVANWLMKVADHCPVVIVRGNHDVVGDLEIFGRLETTHPVYVQEGAGVQEVEIPAIDDIVSVAAIAWPRKAELLALLGDVSHEEAEQTAGDALRNVLRGLGMQMSANSGPKVLLMHAMVCGSRVSTGQPLVGCDMEIGIDDLGLAGADFYALGHIHMGQDWAFNGAPIAYPGSPRRTAYGELEEKGYILVELSQGFPQGWDVTWQRVPTPATRMLLLEANFTPEHGMVWIANESLPLPQAKAPDWEPLLYGAEVRIRYNVEADHRDAAKETARAIEADVLGRYFALAVKVEEVVIAHSRARMPEIATAHTLTDKLNLLWKARNTVPDAVRATRLLGRAVELETEARNAA